MLGSVLAAAVVGGAAFAGSSLLAGGDEPTDSVAAAVETVATPSATPSAAASTAPSKAPSKAPSAAATPARAAGDPGCSYAPTPEPAARKALLPPTVGVETENLYTVTMATNRGDIVFEMDSATTPCTANNLRSPGALHLLRRHGLPPAHDPGHRGPAVR